MRVCDKLADLENHIKELKEKFCENCQQYDCDMCSYRDTDRMDGGEEE